MPELRWYDPLPQVPERILVAGSSGSGKTTVARLVSRVLGVPHTEIDGLYHGPGWVPRESFVADVQKLAAGPRWVLEWQYRAVRPLLLSRADLLVWLDLPRAPVLRQVGLRTLRRRLGRTPLWNGNVEPPLWTFFTCDDHIVRWAWREHPRAAARVRAVQDGPHGVRLPVVRLRSRREVRRWLRGPLGAAAGR